MTKPNKRGRPKKIKFDEKIDFINEKISLHKSKWFLKSVQWLDWEDVAQIIRIHIYKKWNMWDQKRSLGPWLNTIISNQIKNLLRNYYGNYVRPCSRCPFNPTGSVDHVFENNNSCIWTKSGNQDNSCPLYKKWSTSKKSSFHINTAYSLDAVDFINPKSSAIDIDKSKDKIHSFMKKELNEKNYAIYKMIYIDNLEYEEIAKILGYKSNEKKRAAGYKQIKNYEKSFKQLAQKIIKKYDIL